MPFTEEEKRQYPNLFAEGPYPNLFREVHDLFPDIGKPVANTVNSSPVGGVSPGEAAKISLEKQLSSSRGRRYELGTGKVAKAAFLEYLKGRLGDVA